MDLNSQQTERDYIDTKDLYWVAGILEGEGCFHLRIQNYNGRRIERQLLVRVKMCDEDIIRRLRRVTRIGQTYGPYKGTKKPTFVWSIHDQKEAASLMMTVYPLMGERRQEKIREVLQWWRTSKKG